MSLHVDSDALDAQVVEWQRTRERRLVEAVHRAVSPLIDRWAKATPGRRYYSEDLAQGAVLSLYRAMDGFRPAKGRFVAHFVRKMRSRMGEDIYQDRKHKADHGLDMLEDIASEEASALDTLTAWDEFVTIREAVSRLRGEFKPREWAVVEGVLLGGRTYAQLGRELGVTKAGAAAIGGRCMPKVAVAVAVARAIGRVDVVTSTAKKDGPIGKAVCAHCGASFAISKARAGKARFCSRACMGLARRVDGSQGERRGFYE